MQTPIATTAKPTIADLTGGNDKKHGGDATEIAFLDLLTDADQARDKVDSLASTRVSERQGTREMVGQDTDQVAVQVTVPFAMAGAQPLPAAQGPLRRMDVMQGAWEGSEKPSVLAIPLQWQAPAGNGENIAREMLVQPGQRGFFGMLTGQKTVAAQPSDAVQPAEQENEALARGGYPPEAAVSDISASAQPVPDGPSGIQALEAVDIPVSPAPGLHPDGGGISSDHDPGKRDGQVRPDGPGAIVAAFAERTQIPISADLSAKPLALPALPPGASSLPERRPDWPPSVATRGRESKAIRGGNAPSGAPDPLQLIPPGTPATIPPGNRGPGSGAVIENGGENLKGVARTEVPAGRRMLETAPSRQEPSGHQKVKKPVETGQTHAGRTPQSGISPDGHVAPAEQKVGRNNIAGGSAAPRVSGLGSPKTGNDQGGQPFSRPLPAASELVSDRPPGRPVVSSPSQSGAVQGQVSLQRPAQPLPTGSDPVAFALAAEVPGQRPSGAAPRAEKTESKAESRAPALPEATALPPQSPSEGRSEVREARPATAPPAIDHKVNPEFSARDTPLLRPGDDTEDSLAAPLDAAQGARGHSAPAVSHGPASEPALARRIAGQIAELARRPASGPVELVLSPEELGRVRLVMTMDHGALNVSVVAERAETQDLMRRHIETLAQDLRAVGYRDVSFSFGSGDGAQSRSGFGAERPASAQPGDPVLSTHEASIIHSPEAAPPGRTTPSGRVDIRL